MDGRTEQLALRYVDYLRTGDEEILAEAFAADHLDHVSGQRGVEIMRTVRGWIEASFADVEYEVHAVTTGGDLAMVWFSTRGRHIGSAFPQFAGREPTGKTIVAEAVHILRVVDGKLAEHWAVRDDLGVLRQLDTLDGATQPVRSRPTVGPSYELASAWGVGGPRHRTGKRPIDTGAEEFRVTCFG